jgi:hypothetical protein
MKNIPDAFDKFVAFNYPVRQFKFLYSLHDATIPQH